MVITVLLSASVSRTPPCVIWALSMVTSPLCAVPKVSLSVNVRLLSATKIIASFCRASEILSAVISVITLASPVPVFFKK